MPKPIKLSRSSIDLFLDCPLCFYRKIVQKINRPDRAKYSLNLEIDKLLKQEFDHYRSLQKPHPIITKYSLPYLPAKNSNLHKWRHNFTGIQHLHKNLHLYGSIDDLWVNPETGEHTVVDYKATSSQYPLSQTRLESYNTQLSFYSWLLQKNGLKMANINYILLYNAYTPDTTKHLERTLNLTPTLIPIPNNTSWITGTLQSIQSCLASLEEPKPSEECIYCSYIQKVDNQNQAVTLPF